MGLESQIVVDSFLRVSGVIKCELKCNVSNKGIFESLDIGGKGRERK